MELTSKQRFFMRVLLTILGCILLGFSTAIFLTKNYIVNGGLSGIAMIVQFYMPENQVIDIVVWILNAFFLILAFFTLGKKFALNTLIATIVYPASLTLFLRVPCFQDFAATVSGDGSVGYLILCALFGGLLNGVGLALTFLGKGSTGGTDVLLFLLKKIANINVSVSSFVVDAAIILTGIFALAFPSKVINCLCGIITAGVTALVIEVIYTKQQNAVIVDIITEKSDVIIDYVIGKLDRTATIVDTKGAFTNKKNTMLRIVVSKNEYRLLKDFIAINDPTAFYTFTNTNTAFGEGWLKNKPSYSRKNKDLHGK